MQEISETSNSNSFCPNCGSPKTKSWAELTADEKLLVEKISSPAARSERADKNRILYCARCFYPVMNERAEKA